MKVRDTAALLTAFVAASLLYQTTGAGESSEGELVWIEGDSQVAADSGSSLELTCHCKISDLPNVVWVKVNDDGSEILAHDEKLLIVNDRLSINYNSSEGISVLKIENAKNEDSGRYECQVPMMNSTITAAIEVLVKDDAEEAITSPTPDVSPNTSPPDEEMSPASKGHSVTCSVFSVSSFVCVFVLFNAIPAVTQC